MLQPVGSKRVGHDRATEQHTMKKWYLLEVFIFFLSLMTNDIDMCVCMCNIKFTT